MTCRSDPHVDDIRTLTTTSCGLTITGSGTFSTRKSATPFQHRARMIPPFSSRLPLSSMFPSVRRRCRARPPESTLRFPATLAGLARLLPLLGPRRRVVLDGRDLAGLGEALERAQRVREQQLRHEAE